MLHPEITVCKEEMSTLVAVVAMHTVWVDHELKLLLSLMQLIDKQQSVLKLVQEMGKSIRGELGRLVAKQLRIVPELIFCLDDSLDYVERIDELLSK